MSQNPERKYSLEEMEEALKRSPLPQVVDKTDRHGNICAIEREGNGNLVYRLSLGSTFGLPIEPEVVIPIDLSEIYQSWPNNPYIPGNRTTKQAFIQPEFMKNEFEKLPEDLFSSTVYAVLADAFASIQAIEAYPVYKEGMYLPNQLVNVPDMKFRCNDDINVFIAQGQVKIEILGSIRRYSLINLNKLAYSVHVAAEYLKAQPATTFTPVSVFSPIW